MAWHDAGGYYPVRPSLPKPGYGLYGAALTAAGTYGAYKAKQAYDNWKSKSAVGSSRKFLVKKVKPKVSQKKTTYGKKIKLRRRRPVNVKKRVSKLSKQVSKLNKFCATGTGTLIFHDRQTYTCRSAVNQFTHQLAYAMRTTEMEAVLAQLRFFDPANPATLVNASGASGAYARDYLFKTIYTKTCIRNNYQVPARVTYYCCCPKEDTSITPVTAFTNGLTDQGNPTATSMLLHLTDSIQFNDLWRIAKSQTWTLMPGQEVSQIMSVKDVCYDPANTDEHTLAYQAKNRAYQIVIRVEGVIAHDSSVSTEQGFIAAGVDICNHTKYVVQYEAGVDLNFIYINDNADTFTNGGLVSSMPVADNIAYSIN